MICEFASTTRFVDFVKKNFRGSFGSAILFFENDQTYKNQFDRVCIRPVFITLKGKGKQKNVYLTHKQIFEKWDNKFLVVSFAENQQRQLPKEQGLICELCIDFEPKTYKDQTYFDSYIMICSNEKNIEMIRKNSIKMEIKKDEEELPNIDI